MTWMKWAGGVLIVAAIVVHGRATATSPEQATAILVGVLLSLVVGLILVLLGLALGIRADRKKTQQAIRRLEGRSD